ncbi:MAG: hypothetical protein LBD25_00195 [Coriobacteriales bacterium]|jgi:hypothetical protein|nr:hypothetical protein [Coriobacteriales bacterium]
MTATFVMTAHTMLGNLLASGAPLAAGTEGDGSPLAYVGIALMLAGPLFFGITFARYRNRGQRHHHERETPVTMSNLQSFDNYAGRLEGQRSSRISGANSSQVGGSLVQGGIEGVAGQLLGTLLPGEGDDQPRRP